MSWKRPESPPNESGKCPTAWNCPQPPPGPSRRLGPSTRAISRKARSTRLSTCCCGPGGRLVARSPACGCACMAAAMPPAGVWLRHGRAAAIPSHSPAPPPICRKNLWKPDFWCCLRAWRGFPTYCWKRRRRDCRPWCPTSAGTSRSWRMAGTAWSCRPAMRTRWRRPSSSCIGCLRRARMAADFEIGKIAARLEAAYQRALAQAATEGRGRNFEG